MCARSCKQTLPARCLLDPRKIKGGKDGSGLHGAMNGMRTASRYSRSAWGFSQGQLERCKRGEALDPCTPVVYMGFEHGSIQESGRRGFVVKPTAKYVDECLDLVQLQNAKPVVTPLT